MASASDAAAARSRRRGRSSNASGRTTRTTRGSGRGGAREEDVAEVVALRAPSREVEGVGVDTARDARGDADGELLEPGEALGEVLGEESSDAGRAREQAGPDGVRADAQGGDETHAGDHHAAVFRARGRVREPERGRGRGRGGDAAGRARALLGGCVGGDSRPRRVREPRDHRGRGVTRRRARAGKGGEDHRVRPGRPAGARARAGASADGKGGPVADDRVAFLATIPVQSRSKAQIHILKMRPKRQYRTLAE